MALEFNGTTQYVDGNVDISWTNANSFTIAAWVYTNANNTGQGIVGQPSNGTTTYEWSFYMNGALAAGQLGFYYWDDISGTGLNVEFAGVIPATTWTHVAITYDGNNGRLYKAGVLQNTVAKGARAWLVNASNVNIGRCHFGGEAYWNGKLRDIRIYDRTLSADELIAIATMRGKLVTVPDKHWWPLNEGAPGTNLAGAGAAKDWTGQSHGTAANAPVYRESPIYIR